MTHALSFLVLQPIISLATDLGEVQWSTVKMNSLRVRSMSAVFCHLILSVFVLKFSVKAKGSYLPAGIDLLPQTRMISS